MPQCLGNKRISSDNALWGSGFKAVFFKYTHTNTYTRVEIKLEGHERTREGKTDITESKIPRNLQGTST